ncbi:hypothetical protein M4I32_00230 [Microbacterium sp. LRZ72]|uniref:hypothetical protein n=1 Tax=Microbacterium sp. LRZ72 TaxID=2942481 RepID=UPI0029A953AF|nr:hypothetical protein [Microbacterium sp. LRZ72]MDX2375230.1 hypothetical protein [Microbacterium sp. LRZ72]
MAEDALAWVESPLQLLGAAEWAAAHGVRTTVAGRLTAQMSETSAELVRREAPFGEMHPYLGIPWLLLARHRHWLVGDGFSGQFRLAASLLRPARVTFLDDGANTLAFADALTGRRPYARPGNDERGLIARVAPFALDHVRTRALAGGVALFTAFDPGPARLDALADLGVGVARHRFAWTRAASRDMGLSTSRVLLGSARPIDGRLDTDVYLDWVAAEAATAPVTYLPHRRESRAQLDAVSGIPGVLLAETHLPTELVLAGVRRPLDVLTLASSTTTTLPMVLEGTGSRIRERDPALRHRRKAVR